MIDRPVEENSPCPVHSGTTLRSSWSFLSLSPCREEESPMATTPGLSTAQVLRGALDAAHQILDATMADVDDALANRPTPGQANPIGASYAHTLLMEDAEVNGLLQGQPPLWASSWAGRTGTDRPMPFPGLVEGDLGEWYRTVWVDLGACREYAQAVYAASAEFIGTADDATLARAIDMSFAGMGTLPLALMFSIFVTGHVNNLCGEISAIKGTFGLKGYPF